MKRFTFVALITLVALTACKHQGSDAAAAGSEIKDSPLSVVERCFDSSSPNTYNLTLNNEFRGYLHQDQIGGTVVEAQIVGRQFVGVIGTMQLVVVYDSFGRRAQVFQNFGTFMNLLGTLPCHGPG